MKPSALGIHTVTHPGPDGTLYHFSRPRMVELSAGLRRSRLSCTLALDTSRPATVEPCGSHRRSSCRFKDCSYGCGGTGVVRSGGALLVVSWQGPGTRGHVKLLACEPTAKGAAGTVVDVLPVEGLALRPIKAPPRERTVVVSMPVLGRRLYALHGEAAKEYPRLSADDWTAREELARALLGADFGRVTEAA